MAVGVPLMLGATRVLMSQLFGVKAADPSAISVAVAGLLAIMTAASAWPAYRASRIDPLLALKID
jgi:ABC-type antimicrobial peptide transport system permease subunit